MSVGLYRKYLNLRDGYNHINKFIVAIVIGAILMQLESVSGINMAILRYFVYTAAMYFFIKGIVLTHSTSNYKGVFINTMLAVLFLSIVYSVIIALPSVMSAAGNYINLKKVLSGQLLLFLFPLILLIKPSLVVIKKVLASAYVLSILFLVVLIPFISYFTNNRVSGIEVFVRSFASGSTFVLLTIVYHSKKVKVITILTFILSFLLMVLYARRNMILYMSLILIFLIVIMYFTHSRRVKNSRLNFTLGMLFIGLVSSFVIYFSNLDFTYAVERFTTTAEEGINYSRDFVLSEFEADFNSKPTDWIIGRGMNGTFYSILGGGRDKYNVLQAGQRDGIENGYYHLILKSGLWYVVPLILLSIIGFIKGFFYSRNVLSKAAAAIVLVNLIDLIGFGVPQLTLKYLILWLSLALCYSSKIRSYSDDLIKRFIAIK